MSVWPAARLSRALDLHELGYSHGEIARELGCFQNYPDGGRNAVIGALHRASGYRSQRRVHAEPSQKEVLAAAIVSDAFDEAMAATGLSLNEVQHAVRMSRRRERREAANAQR